MRKVLLFACVGMAAVLGLVGCAAPSSQISVTSPIVGTSDAPPPLPGDLSPGSVERATAFFCFSGGVVRASATTPGGVDVVLDRQTSAGFEEIARTEIAAPSGSVESESLAAGCYLVSLNSQGSYHDGDVCPYIDLCFPGLPYAERSLRFTYRVEF